MITSSTSVKLLHRKINIEKMLWEFLFPERLSMKKTMNFTFTHDDVERFSSAEELREFYEGYHLNGLELMPLSDKEDPDYGKDIVKIDMIVGVHLVCIIDWMEKDKKMLLEHYKRELDFAREVDAEYVVFHIAQADDEENFTYQLKHTDEEVIDAMIPFINELLDDQGYTFDFLMENLWWPGLTLRRPEMTKYLLNGVHYEHKGIMLDTGHYLHTDWDIDSLENGIQYLNEMLGTHEEFLPYFKGIHLQQSLTGEYVKNFIANAPALSNDPEERFCQSFEHIFQLDKHEPFDHPDIKAFVERVNPKYLTFEYITGTKEQLIDYLERGTKYFL